MKASDVIVDEIRRLLDDPEETTHEQLTELAREFAQSCRRFEELAARICAALDVDALCEAARVAKSEKILDEYQALNFDQIEDWRNACRALGLPVSPPLSSQNAARIAEFLLVYDQHERLFATHRRLAIAGADFFSRLDVLYRLQAAFPTRTIWDAQLQELETLRDKELQTLFRNTPPSRENLEFWQDRLAELENPRRLQPATPAFLAKLRSSILNLRREKALEEASKVARKWQAAADAQNKTDVLALYQDWNQALAALSKLGATPPPELLEAIRQPLTLALDWERLDAALVEFGRKLRHLNDLLESSESVEEISDALETAKIAADAAQTSVPLPIIEECESRFASSELQKRRSLTIVVGFCLLFALCLATAGFLLARDSQMNREARAAASALQTQLDRFEGINGHQPDYAALAEAQKTLTTYEQKPHIASSQEFTTQAERCLRLSAQDDERLRLFNDDVESLKAAHAQNKSRPRILPRLKNSARTDAETNLYLDLKTRDDEIRRAEIKVNDAEYLERLNALLDRKDALEKNVDDVESRLAEIAEIRAELKKLDADFAERLISQRLQDSRASFVKAFEQIATNAQQDAELEKLALELRDVVGNPTRFEALLTRLSSMTSTEAVETPLKTLALLPALDAWNQFVQNDELADWTASSASLANTKETLTPVLNAISNFSPEIQKVAEQLQGLGPEALGRKELAQELKKSFAPFAPKLYLYVPAGGAYYYYLTSKPENVKDKPEVFYCVQVVNGKPKTERFNLTIIKASEYDDVDLALQYIIYEKIQALPSVPDAETWRACVEETLDLILSADETSLDPAAKILLLKRLIPTICKDPDYQAFEEWNAELADVDLQINHYKSTRTLRNFRDAAISKLNKLAALSADAGLGKTDGNAAAPYLERSRLAFEARQNAPSFAPYRWVGFVDVVDNVARLASPDDVNLEDGSLYIVNFNDDSPTAELCGQTQNGQAKLNTGFVARRWSPVFLRPAPKTDKTSSLLR